MTPEQVRERVAAIAAAAGDDEHAHGLQDTLYLDVLTAIANRTATDPAAVAREAIVADLIEFGRYTA